ncbi:MAG: tetratricopeptide repeat protein [Planctomycetota bacterium]
MQSSGGSSPDLSLPQPLARIVPVMDQARGDARSLHAAAFASLEAVVRWQGLLLLTARSRLSMPVDREKRVQNFLKRPSFGSWVEVLLRHGARDHDRTSQGTGPLGILEDLKQILETPREEYTAMVKAISGRGGTKPQRWIDALEHLPHYRNDFIGHAGFLADDHYEEKAPLFDAVVTAILEEMARVDQTLQARSLENADQSLSLQGSGEAEEGSGAIPEKVQPGECYLTRSSGDLLIAMGELTHLHQNDVFLFDRTPRERRTEFIDFASGERSRRDGLALLESGFTENLSLDRVEGSSAEVVTGRLALRAQVLRYTVTTGERLWSRVVLQNQSPIPARFHVQGAESSGWSWCEDTFVEDQEVGPNETRVWFVAATADHAGTIAPPVIRVTSSFDPRPQVLESEGPVRIIDSDPLPLVGRAGQAQKIVDHLSDRQSHGAVTLIGGAQGQRTGALLEEIGRQCRLQGMRDLRGTFRGTAGQPLKAFNDLLRDLVGLQSGDSAAEQIRETASVQLEQWLGEDAAAIAYFLDELTGESSPEKSSEQMRSFWWFKLVSAVAREMPLLITLDDYEEADPDSQKLLRGLLERCRQEEIPASYALTTDREEDQKTAVPEGWPGDPKPQIIEIDRVASAEIEQLLTLAYPGSPVLDDLPWLSQELEDRAAGNIGFAIDLVRSLGPADKGIFEPGEEQHWKLVQPLPQREAFSDSLPARRGDLYSGLLEKMPPEQVAIFETSALIDGEIPVEVLERLHDDADALDDALDRFETDGFGEAVDTDLTIYRFRTETARDAVLEHFDKSGRRAAMRRRRQLAGALVDLYGEESDHAGSIGKLYLAGGQAPEALPHLLGGMLKRKSQGRFVEASDLHGFLKQAIEAGAEIPIEQLPNYHLEWADLQLTLGDREGAESTLNSGEFRESSPELAKAGMLRFKMYSTAGSFEDGYTVLKEIADVVESLNDTEIEIRYRTNLAIVLMFKGDLEESLQESDRELELVRNSGSEFELARCLNNRGTIFTHMANNFVDSEGALEQSGECFQEAASVFGAVGRLDLNLMAKVGFAAVEFRKGNLESAGVSYQLAIDGFRLLQNRQALSRNYYNLGDVLRFQGHLDLAQDHLIRSVKVREEIGDQLGLVQSLYRLTEIHAFLGDWEKAAAASDRALKISRLINQEELIQEGEIRQSLNQLSSGLEINDLEIKNLNIGLNGKVENRVLWYTLVCRSKQVGKYQLSAEDQKEIMDLVDVLFTLPTSHMLCLLSASIAPFVKESSLAKDLLEKVILAPHIPMGAPLDMVLSARALLEPADSPEREEWESRAMTAVEERSKLIERPADRRRFLKARLRRLEE